jgi:hypothetical protein
MWECEGFVVAVVARYPSLGGMRPDGRVGYLDAQVDGRTGRWRYIRRQSRLLFPRVAYTSSGSDGRRGPWQEKAPSVAAWLASGGLDIIASFRGGRFARPSQLRTRVGHGVGRRTWRSMVVRAAWSEGRQRSSGGAAWLGGSGEPRQVGTPRGRYAWEGGERSRQTMDWLPKNHFGSLGL